MTKLSDLPEDLVAEILSRVPISSVIPVRSTCKPWNGLSKKLVLGTRAEDATKKKQLFQEFMKFNSRVCSLKFNLQGIRNEENEFINPSIKQLSVFDEFKVSQVIHCDGLLLCVTMEKNPRVIVWNPYLGQTRWIKPVNKFHKQDWFALGFDNNNNHKILRFGLERDRRVDVYDFSSDSWRVLDICHDSEELCLHNAMSLKGNTYFFDQKLTIVETEVAYQSNVIDIVDYLVCFDYTSEKFGPRLPLPFHRPYPNFHLLTLSSVRDEKLSLLYQQYYDTSDIMEIWVSTKIEPNAITWSNFFRVDMLLINGLLDNFEAQRFFIDEVQKVAVVFSQEPCTPPGSMKTKAYIIGEDGYIKSVSIREAGYISDYHVCSSYVPSLVHV